MFLDGEDVGVDVEDSSDAIGFGFVVDDDGAARAVVRYAYCTAHVGITLDRFHSCDRSRTEEVEDGGPVVGSFVGEANRHQDLPDFLRGSEKIISRAALWRWDEKANPRAVISLC